MCQILLFFTIINDSTVLRFFLSFLWRAPCLFVFLHFINYCLYCTFHVSLGIGIITNRVYHKTQTHFFKKNGPESVFELSINT